MERSGSKGVGEWVSNFSSKAWAGGGAREASLAHGVQIGLACGFWVGDARVGAAGGERAVLQQRNSDASKPIIGCTFPWRILVCCFV